MNKVLKINSGSPLVNLAVSVIIHLGLFFAIGFILKGVNQSQMVRSVYVQVSTGIYTKEETEEPEKSETEDVEQEKDIVPDKPVEKGVSFTANADTTGLKNIYSESTLNVKIKYPSGWTFMDQNVKNKLDGVTFWGLSNIYNPPPYIHLEVKEKYLFNPSRFKYNEEFEDYTIYYNDPVELSEQFTQIIYIRTEEDEDYSLKLIMKGKESFFTFQPVFFGMLKTFSFGE